MTPLRIALVLVAAAQVATPPRDSRPAAAAATASVTGQVVDDRGAPVPGAVVVLAGGPAVPGARSAITTEEGRYRIDDIAPGFYTMGITKAGYPEVWIGQRKPRAPGKVFEIAAAQRVTNRLTLPRGAAIAGTIVDDSGQPRVGSVAVFPEPPPPSGARSAVTVRVNGRGEFRAFGLPAGTYRVTPQLAPPPPDAPGGVVVTVAPGEERDGIVVRIVPPRPATYVTVSVAASDGTPTPSFQLTLRRAGNARSAYASSRPNADGTRTLTDLVAGTYTIIARNGPYMGSADVLVDGEHPGSVSISLVRGVSVQGVATFDGEPPARARTVMLGIGAADASSLFDENNSANGWVERDGRFTIPGVPAGRHVLYVGSGDGWTLASAKIGDVDITDSAFTIGREDIPGVTIALTRTRTMLRGKVSDATGSPLNGVYVVAFPLDEKYRVRGSRRVQSNRTTIGGEYELTGLPPGRYGLAVEDEIDQQALRDPENVAKLRAVATVTLTAGETTRDVVVR